VSATPDTGILLETSLGSIEITLFVAKAPASARAVLALVDDGSFAREGTLYRAVRSDENDHGQPRIDVIQGGLLHPPSSLAAIEHETTEHSGLLHLNGTVSLARGEAGTATGAAFFICVGDQPALDFGGGRKSDGLGFAAFGRVTKGIDVVRRIHRLPTRTDADNPYLRGQMLDPAVRISSAHRKAQGG
jgi:peptidyl-prolyl cis-trans isomerase A (cyclophilin A)